MFYRDARVSANCKVFGKINDSGALRRRAALDKDAGLVVLFDCQIAYMAVDYLETAAAVKADTDRAGAVGEGMMEVPLRTTLALSPLM